MQKGFTHRPLSSSFSGLPCRILNINHKKELLRGLCLGFGFELPRGGDFFLWSFMRTGLGV